MESQPAYPMCPAVPGTFGEQKSRAWALGKIDSATIGPKPLRPASTSPFGCRYRPPAQHRDALHVLTARPPCQAAAPQHLAGDGGRNAARASSICWNRTGGTMPSAIRKVMEHPCRTVFTRSSRADPVAASLTSGPGARSGCGGRWRGCTSECGHARTALAAARPHRWPMYRHRTGPSG